MSEKTVNPVQQYLGFRQSAQKQLDNVKIQIAKDLQGIADIVRVLNDDGVTNLWSDPQYAQALTEAGLQPIGTTSTTTDKPKSATRKPRVTVTDDQILKYLGDEERKQGDIATHFDTTTVTVKRKLDELAKAKKVSSRKDGVAVLWKVK